MVNASGNSSKLFNAPAMMRHITARQPADVTTMARRAPRLWSMTGPRNGATTAKGAIVSSR